VPVAEGYLGGGGKHEQQNLALLEELAAQM
jgi:hypothetical protein